MWKRMDGLKDGKRWIKKDTKIVDIRKTILKDFALSPHPNMEFVIGTDSQVRGKNIVFTVVIVRGNYSDTWDRRGSNPFSGEKTGWWDMSYGCRVYFENISKPIIAGYKPGTYSDKQRLIEESYESIKVALWLNPILEPLGYIYLEGQEGDPESKVLKTPKWQVDKIHADIHTDKREFSNSVIGAVSGVIRGHGFTPVFKPQSWVAYAVADHRTRY